MCSAFLACGSVAGFLGSVALIHGSVVNSKTHVGYCDYGGGYGTFTFNTVLHVRQSLKGIGWEFVVFFTCLSLTLLKWLPDTDSSPSQVHLSPEARQSQSLLLL